MRQALQARIRQTRQQADFSGFAKPRKISLSRFVCLSQYDEKLDAAVAYGSDDLPNTLSDVLAANHCTQLRIAETEKYAHVTFFFSGGREPMASGEDRVLIPSPKVATYDMQPEMSCPELTAKLVAAIREVLTDAIREGGTTLRDFLNSDGEPGYFRQRLFVYERKGEPCRVCGTPIRHAVLGQRSTYWCPKCQK